MSEEWEISDEDAITALDGLIFAFENMPKTGLSMLPIHDPWKWVVTLNVINRICAEAMDSVPDSKEEEAEEAFMACDIEEFCQISNFRKFMRERMW